MTPNEVTVSVDWLYDNRYEETIVIIDGSWHLPPAGRDASAEFTSEHIPDAIFFDIDKHSDQTSPLPHMMPSAEQFGNEMGELGISENCTIVVYDTHGLFSAARVWWMFKQFGASKVFVLDGGLKAWKGAGYPVESGIKKRTPKVFNAQRNDSYTIDLDNMKTAVHERNALILDARGADRFNGKAPEPRPGLRSGHMPGAVNLPYPRLLDENGVLKQPHELEDVVKSVGFEAVKTTIATCGSGVTAAIIVLALARLGYQETLLYDGSWSEWGATEDAPVTSSES